MNPHLKKNYPICAVSKHLHTTRFCHRFILIRPWAFLGAQLPSLAVVTAGWCLNQIKLHNLCKQRAKQTQTIRHDSIDSYKKITAPSVISICRLGRLIFHNHSSICSWTTPWCVTRLSCLLLEAVSSASVLTAVDYVTLGVRWGPKLSCHGILWQTRLEALDDVLNLFNRSRVDAVMFDLTLVRGAHPVLAGGWWDFYKLQGEGFEFEDPTAER